MTSTKSFHTASIHTVLRAAAGALATLVAQLSLATDQQEQAFDQELLSPQEHAEYREMLRAAHTEAEREALHQAHHDLIEARARACGVPLV